MFLGPCHFADVGVTIVVDRPRLLRATFGNFVADGDANRAIWPFLGANAVKPCMACKNVLKLNHPALERQSYLIDVSCTTTSKFDPMTNEDIWKTFDDLEAAQGVLRKTDLDKLEKASGFRFNSNYLLADKALRQYVKPADACTVDPMHDSVSNGFVNVELYCFTERCRSVCGIHYEDFQCHCLASWHLPHDSDTKQIAPVFPDRGSMLPRKSSYHMHQRRC